MSFFPFNMTNITVFKKVITKVPCVFRQSTGNCNQTRKAIQMS